MMRDAQGNVTARMSDAEAQNIIGGVSVQASGSIGPVSIGGSSVVGGPGGTFDLAPDWFNARPTICSSREKVESASPATSS